MLGQFWADVHTVGLYSDVVAKKAKLLVIDSGPDALLGVETCLGLGLISIATNHVVEKVDFKVYCPSLFSGGIGRVDDEITLSVDDTVTTVDNSSVACESKENTNMFVGQIVFDDLLGFHEITAKQVERVSEQDEELSHVRQAILEGSFDRVPVELAKEYQPISDELCAVGRVLLRGNRIVVPVSLRPEVIELGHEGHLGIVGTKQNLRSRIRWPGIDAQVENHVKFCKGVR